MVIVMPPDHITAPLTRVQPRATVHTHRGPAFEPQSLLSRHPSRRCTARLFHMTRVPSFDLTHHHGGPSMARVGLFRRDYSDLTR